MKRKHRKPIIYQGKHNDPVTERLLKDRSISVIVDNFHGVNWWEKCKVFPLFTVYYDTKDYPGKYVARLFDGQQPTRLLVVTDTLEAVREAIPPMFYRVPREPGDEPKILEAWL